MFLPWINQSMFEVVSGGAFACARVRLLVAGWSGVAEVVDRLVWST